jgi:hypothetical protein
VPNTTFLRTGARAGRPARVRAALRAGSVAALTSVPLLAAAAAFADTHTYDGEDSGPGLSVLQTVGIYVCIPLGAFLLIAFLVLAPSWIKGDRNRREVGWSGQSQPIGSGAALAAAKPKAPAEAADPADREAASSGAGAKTGGASGTWQN